MKEDRMSQEPQTQQPQTPPPPPPQWNRDEKDEKDEKDRGHEKSYNDALSALVWAALFIWAGLVLLADNMGMLQDLYIVGQQMSAWSIIFTGAGIILLIEVLIRLLIPAYRRHVTGTLIFAGILLAIGLGGSFGWSIIWPLIFILIGVTMLIGALTRR
jgi:hypothetical protein